jgi:hypothetical protein
MSDSISSTPSDAGPTAVADSPLIPMADLVEIVRAVETLYLPAAAGWDADEGDDTAAIGVPIDMLAADDAGDSFLMAADPLALADMPFDAEIAFAAWSSDALIGFDPMLDAMSAAAATYAIVDAALRGDALVEDVGGADMQPGALSWIAGAESFGLAAHWQESWSWDGDAGACVFGGFV